MKVILGISNRHVHLNKADLETLFGKDYTLKVKNYVRQPGQFSSTDVVSIKTPKITLENIRIMGPIRDYTQVEISRTDAYKLGINPPVETSGHLEHAEPITIIGPKGEVQKEHACIQANRHLHISKKELKELGFSENQKLKVKINGIKGGILDDVFLKVLDDSLLELHLDTDDANAFMLKNGDELEIVGSNE